MNRYYVAESEEYDDEDRPGILMPGKTPERALEMLLEQMPEYEWLTATIIEGRNLSFVVTDETTQEVIHFEARAYASWMLDVVDPKEKA